MAKVKICGLTREEDLHFVNSERPEYVGFVFAKSKRQVDRDTAKKLIRLLNKEIKAVGVFVNSTMDEVNDIADYCELDIVQLHGDETPQMCEKAICEVWKAFRIQDQHSFHLLKEYQVDGYLLDAYDQNQFGGTGTAFDWDLCKNICIDKQMILAGGITPDNVEQAIALSNAQIIDVSSGVETNGIKDVYKIKTLLERVRQNGRKNSI